MPRRASLDTSGVVTATVAEIAHLLEDPLELEEIYFTAIGQPVAEDSRLPDEWGHALKTQRGMLGTSVGMALDKGSIRYLGVLRRLPREELLTISGIGLGRVAILKSFGRYTDHEVTLDDLSLYSLLGAPVATIDQSAARCRQGADDPHHTRV